jgi:hypothetical protein
MQTPHKTDVWKRKTIQRTPKQKGEERRSLCSGSKFIVLSDDHPAALGTHLIAVLADCGISGGYSAWSSTVLHSLLSVFESSTVVLIQ